jgi:hypothetical protein
MYEKGGGFLGNRGDYIRKRGEVPVRKQKREAIASKGSYVSDRPGMFPRGLKIKIPIPSSYLFLSDFRSIKIKRGN